jgi:hypothetical protein
MSSFVNIICAVCAMKFQDSFNIPLNKIQIHRKIVEAANRADHVFLDNPYFFLRWFGEAR